MPNRMRLGSPALHCRLLLSVLVIGLFVSSGLSAAPRTLTTAYGEITLEDTPKRVVTLYEGALDTAYAVGITPVGAVITRGGTDVAKYMEERVEDIAIVGTPREANLEAVVAQKPDLILAAPQLTPEQYRLLSQVAPTLVPANTFMEPDSWKKEARFFAHALDKQDQIESVLTKLDRRIKALAERFAKQVPTEQRQASLVRWMPPGALVLSPELFAGSLLRAVGFYVRGGHLISEGRPHSHPLSLENLVQIDGDWLFLATLNEEGQDALNAAKGSPAFARLDVVKNDRVVPVDGQLWTSASGPIAAAAILDDIEAQLAPEKD